MSEPETLACSLSGIALYLMYLLLPVYQMSSTVLNCKKDWKLTLRIVWCLFTDY